MSDATCSTTCCQQYFLQGVTVVACNGRPSVLICDNKVLNQTTTLFVLPYSETSVMRLIKSVVNRIFIEFFQFYTYLSREIFVSISPRGYFTPWNLFVIHVGSLKYFLNDYNMVLYFFRFKYTPSPLSNHKKLKLHTRHSVREFQTNRTALDAAKRQLNVL